MLARGFAITLLLATVAFSAGEMHTVALSCASGIGFGVVGRRVVSVSFWAIGCGGGGAFAMARQALIGVSAIVLHRWMEASG